MYIWCWIEEFEGMSDLCMYELEDNIWDEFSQNDDHIVPHPSDGHANGYALQGDSYKKPRREVIGVSSYVGDQYASTCVSRGGDERNFPTLSSKRNTMLDKDSWSHTPDGGAFPTSFDNDSIKEVTSLASDDTRMPSQCFKGSNIDSVGSEFCVNDPILGDRCAAVDSGSYDYPFSHISQSENDLSFIGNDRDDKEANDLLYYGWPDIGNFEDVDRMFRSCDTTFGLGGGNEDELGWFSSSDAIEGAVKSDIKVSSPESSALEHISDNHDLSKLNNASSSMDDSCMKSECVSYKVSSLPLGDDEPASLNNLSFVNWSNKNSERKVDYMHKDLGVEFNNGAQFKISTINHSKNENSGMISFHKNQSKHQKQSEEKRKDRFLESSGPFHYSGCLQNQGIKLPSGDASRQVLTSIGIRQQKQNLEPNSFGSLQTDAPYRHSDYSHSSDQTTVSPTLSGIKSENNGITSLSPRESSYASNQVQSIESSHERSFDAPAITLDQKREKLQCRQGNQSSFTSSHKHVDRVGQAPVLDQVSVQKQVHHSGNKFENFSDAEVASMEILADIDSSNVQESSFISSGLDEISLEATSFLHLQHVIEQLDSRTKLCIRDSLYRLARSAEQRHDYANLSGSNGDDRDASGAVIAEGTNKCTGFMDMETDTNPIDRSMAHLLFHRPADSSVMPAHNALPLTSHAMVNGSITSSPGLADKLVFQEETAAEMDRKVADH